jgi:hypothetical protein
MTTVIQALTSPGTVTATTNGPLTCAAPSATLSGSSTLSQGTTYAWTGPGGFTATGTSATATVPGTYALTATYGPSGCTSTGTTTVVQNITAPANVTATNNGPQTCYNVYPTLTGSSTTTGTTYAWTGPNGFTASGATASVTSFGQGGGTYTLTATNPATGCTAVATTALAVDINAPTGVSVTSNAASPVLNCTNTSLTLTASSSTPGVTYAWRIGPTGSTVLGTSNTLTVSQPNNYDVLVTSTENGCAFLGGIAVTQNITPPVSVGITVIPATAQITCSNPTVLLTGTSGTTGATYSWSGTGVVSTSGAAATVNAAGTYTVTVTDPTNGCFASLPTSVTKNVSVPVGLTASPSDIISCFTPVIDLQGGSTTPDATFAWSGPGGYTANTADAETETPGSYTLVVTNPANGCTASTGTVVLADTATPANVTASNNGPLNCVNTSVTITSSSSTSGVDFTWVTPGNTFISGATATVTVPGTYTIQVTSNENGCVSQATTTVVQNTTGCSGSTVATPGVVSGRSMEGFSADAVTGFAYKVYPNPFSTTAFIEFVSPVSAPVRVELYNSFGYAEVLLFNNTVTANQLYKLQLGGSGLSSGTHLCVIRSGDKVYSSKLILIK